MFNLFNNNNNDLSVKNNVLFEEETDYFKINNNNNDTDTESELEQFKNIDISNSTNNSELFDINLNNQETQKTENIQTEENFSYIKDNEYISDDDIEMENAVYIITINNEPYFYSDSLKMARENLLDISRKLKLNSNQELFDNFYINEKNKNEIDIIYSYNLTLFSYNHLKYNIKIHTVTKYS